MQQINKPYEGLFITVEGGEGSGKTTLCGKLHQALEQKGYEVVSTREPGGTPLSEKLRNFLLNPQDKLQITERCELFLFLAARVQHLEEKILPALLQGKVVICDRFNDSTVAYQGCARHLGMNYVQELCNLACQGIEPNCTLFLDLAPEEGFRRLQSEEHSFDRLEQEHMQFHREVRQGFLHLADQFPRRIVILDANLPQEPLLQAAMKALEPFLMLKPSRISDSSR